MLAILVLSLLSAVAAALGVPTGLPNLKVKESVSAPRGWMQGPRAPADHTIELKIALPQPNFSVLETHLYEISDPSHHRYGQHLSKEAVEELVAPHPTSIQLVNEWLLSHGFGDGDFSRSPAKDWVSVRASATLAEEMLDTVSYAKTLHAQLSLMKFASDRRHFTFGPMKKVEMLLSELSVTAFQSRYMIMWILSNPQPCSLG